MLLCFEPDSTATPWRQDFPTIITCTTQLGKQWWFFSRFRKGLRCLISHAGQSTAFMTGANHFLQRGRAFHQRLVILYLMAFFLPVPHYGTSNHLIHVLAGLFHADLIRMCSTTVILLLCRRLDAKVDALRLLDSCLWIKACGSLFFFTFMWKNHVHRKWDLWLEHIGTITQTLCHVLCSWFLSLIL